MILSPLARPPEHPFDEKDGLGDAMDELVESLRDTAVLDWARAVVGCNVEGLA